MAGYGTLASGSVHAFYSNGGTATGSMIDLGTLAGTMTGATSYGFDINDSGEVVGYSTTAASYLHAFIASVGAGGSVTMTDLGTLETNGASYGYGINDYDQVVGYASVPGHNHAFVHYAAAGMVDLNTLVDPASGWTLQWAYAVNNSGIVTGYGTNSAGKTHAFTIRAALPGDANLDGVVNGTDLNIVLSNYNLTFTGDAWTSGDFNSDGTVNGADLNAVLSNYNQSLSGVPRCSRPSLSRATLGMLA